MYSVSADFLTEEVDRIESIDNEIGLALKHQSIPALKSYAQELLYELENEISKRDTQLKIREEDLKKNIRIIEELYDSRRYRIGRFFIRPLEIASLKLGIIREPQRPSNSSPANLKRTD